MSIFYDIYYAHKVTDNHLLVLMFVLTKVTL